jgi:hypothetical protein
MTGRPIGDALREWVDQQEHEEFIRAAEQHCSQQLGRRILPNLRDELQNQVDELHIRFSDRAGRPLRRILVWIDAERNTLNISLEPYDKDVATIRIAR